MYLCHCMSTERTVSNLKPSAKLYLESFLSTRFWIDCRSLHRIKTIFDGHLASYWRFRGRLILHSAFQRLLVPFSYVDISLHEPAHFSVDSVSSLETTSSAVHSNSVFKSCQSCVDDDIVVHPFEELL